MARVPFSPYLPEVIFRYERHNTPVVAVQCTTAQAISRLCALPIGERMRTPGEEAKREVHSLIFP